MGRGAKREGGGRGTLGPQHSMRRAQQGLSLPAWQSKGRHPGSAAVTCLRGAKAGGGTHPERLGFAHSNHGLERRQEHGPCYEAAEAGRHMLQQNIAAAGHGARGRCCRPARRRAPRLGRGWRTAAAQHERCTLPPGCSKQLLGPARSGGPSFSKHFSPKHFAQPSVPSASG